MTTASGRYAAIVPVKHLALAKRRLHSNGMVRRTYALAFLRDVLDALADCEPVRQVVVVTSDEAVIREAAERDFFAVAEPHPYVHESLRLAIDLGLRALSAADAAGPVAVIPSDLPCLTPAALASALRTASQLRSAFVPDHSGTGTTLLTAQSASAMTHCFGPKSAELHRAAGAMELTSVSERLRLDVDDPHDLRRALQLGVGPSTRRLGRDQSGSQAHGHVLQAK